MNEALKKLLEKPILQKYVFQQLDEPAFSELMNQQFYAYFNKELIVRTAVLNQAYRHALGLPPANSTGEIFLMLTEKNMPIAIFKCVALDAHTFLMDISVIHPEYRRQGVYSASLEAILAYSKAQGFGVVTSTHSPSNNPILIAKLQKGFYISAFNISPAFGPEIMLSYFHDPELKTAFLHRCGDIVVSKAMVENDRGTFTILANKLKALGCGE